MSKTTYFFSPKLLRKIKDPKLNSARNISKELFPKSSLGCTILLWTWVQDYWPLHPACSPFPGSPAWRGLARRLDPIPLAPLKSFSKFQVSSQAIWLEHTLKWAKPESYWISHRAEKGTLPFMLSLLPDSPTYWSPAFAQRALCQVPIGQPQSFPLEAYRHLLKSPYSSGG